MKAERDAEKARRRTRRNVRPNGAHSIIQFTVANDGRINFYDDQVATAFDIAIRGDPASRILAADIQLRVKGDARRCCRCSTDMAMDVAWIKRTITNGPL